MQQWLSKNYFELFNLPVSYTVDKKLLAEQYRQLQKYIHPDNFVSGSEQERLLSVQLASYINEAYETLCSPLKKALYLLKLQGINVDSENTTINDTEFLLQQIELRETLDKIPHAEDAEQQLENITHQIQSVLTDYEQQFAIKINSSEKIANNSTSEKAMISIVNKMQFLNKLQKEVETLESELLDD